MTSNKHRVQIKWIAAVYAVLLVLVALSAGCASINPITAAKTLEQKVYATYGTFVVFETQAAELVKAPDVPAEVKALIKQADAAAKPAADAMFDAAVQLVKIKADLEAGQTTEERVLIATQNLNRWYLEAEPRILALITAVKEVSK